MRKKRAGVRNTWLVVAGIFISSFGAVVAACGLDDTAIPILGSTDDASIIDGGANETSVTRADANDGAPACAPKTCASYTSDCHASLDDGCGKKINCSGACPDDQACVPDAGAGVDAGFFCSGAPVCTDAGAPGGNCNTLTNSGNGLTTNCGSCLDNGFTCSTNTCGCAGTVCGGPICCGGTTPNCNDANNNCCARKACTDDHTQCSTAFSNGCGGTLNCQTADNCISGQVCDTATSACCTVTTTCGINCSTNITTNCGTTLPCGACATGTCASNNTCCQTNVCGGTCCPAGQTECMGMSCCMPQSVSMTCGGKCGTPDDNCGIATTCPGGCGDGDTCTITAPATCSCGGATCTTGQTCHRGPGGDHCG